MPRQTFIATHDGHTFQRVSEARVYTYMVLLVRDYAEERAACEAKLRRQWKDDHEYSKTVAAGTAEVLSRWDGESAKDHKARVAKSRSEASADLVDPAQTEPAWVATFLADFDERVASMRSSDGASYYAISGWCSRIDLAEKLASSEARKKRESPLRETLILPVNVKRGSAT